MNAHTTISYEESLAWLASQRPAMTELLGKLVNIDSGSYNKAGVDAVGRVLEALLDDAGIDHHRIPHDTFGDCIQAHLPARADGLGSNEYVLLMGHRDTVFPDGTVAERPFRVDGDLAFGPGVMDMKAGLVMNTFVLLAFARIGGAPVPLSVLYSADEEIASPSSRPVIENAARGAFAVFNSEPARLGGNVVVARNGAAFITVEATGKAAHSGAQHAQGINAIAALAHKIVKLQALTNYDAGITVSVGLIQGGSSVNTVPAQAQMQVDVRFPSHAAMDKILGQVQAVIDQEEVPGATTAITEQRLFLPVEDNPGTQRLMDIYQDCAQRVGFQTAGQFSAGSADSGFSAAVGAPTLCGVGPEGEGAHTVDEVVRLDTLVPRAQAVFRSILRLADG